MRRHPEPEEIALWIFEPQGPQLAESTRAHLEGECPRCHDLAQELRRLAERSATAVRAEGRSVDSSAYTGIAARISGIEPSCRMDDARWFMSRPFPKAALRPPPSAKL